MTPMLIITIVHWGIDFSVKHPCIPKCCEHGNPPVECKKQMLKKFPINS